MTTRTKLTVTTPNIASRRSLVVLVSLVVVLAGCGGGGGDDEAAPPASGNGGLTDFYCALAGVLFGGACSWGAGSSSCTLDFVGNCVSTGRVSTGTRSEPVVLIPSMSLDVEPNGSFATPSLATWGILTPPTGPVGFHTEGTVHDQEDGIDTYIFTPSRRWEVLVQLCASPSAACDTQSARSSLDVAIAHIEVFDPYGNLLATTANDSINGNLIWRLPIFGGMPYYISVVADNTMAQYQDYYLRVIGTRQDFSAEPEPEVVLPFAPLLSLSNESDLMATIDWLPPTQNTDGTALVDLQGYVLYIGDQSGGPYQFSERLDVGLSSYVLTLPDYGIWHIVMTAVNAEGAESAFSNEISAGGPPPDMP